ncbi:MAG: hypothetical protein RR635_01365 [Oscillospiraceae bacterium]
MEYITEETFFSQNAEGENSPYWTGLSGGTRPDGTKYAAFRLVDNKLQVLSAWYGKNVFFRTKGTSGKGTLVAIPDYSALKEQYKKCVRVLNPYSPDTGGSFYKRYIEEISNSCGYLNHTVSGVNISVDQVQIQVFNKIPTSYLTDAEGNYIYDLVAIGAYTDAEPDISGAAAWELKEYVNEGYGFLIGHDTIYGYGGVNKNSNYTPSKTDTDTPMYVPNTDINGHWNMAWLMGANKPYREAIPYEASSMILCLGNWRDKSTLYGNAKEPTSALRVAAVSAGDAVANINARCPTNYPYSVKYDGNAFRPGTLFQAGGTHSNQQIAYGKIWIDFAPATATGTLVAERNSGLHGTNNFYLTTNGNFGMMQIGHTKENLSAAKHDEARILANTILYLSQREPCNVCQSKQNGNDVTHAVTRISSAEQLAKIGNPDYWYTYPLGGCYVLEQDITLPADWKPIENFKGHFSADSHSIETNGKPVFQQSGLLGLNQNGWNLGTNAEKGICRIASGKATTTGIARVVGHLNRLFGTDNTVDYSGYRIEITDANGKIYNCITNREGKYVLSNLPCTSKALSASVFTPTGEKVTQYGLIYAKISILAWNTEETIPLRLAADTVRPVPNQTVKEDENAVFIAAINTSILPKKTTWQYRGGAGDTWKNVSDSTILEAKATATRLVTTPESTFAETTLTLANVQLPLDKLQFRATFVLDGITLSTSDASAVGAAGMLFVKQRPFKITALSDVSVWQGETLEIPAQLIYYKPIGKGITVRWQYRGAPNCTWENVSGSNIIKNAAVQNNYDNLNGAPTTSIGYVSRSTLVFPSASTDINGYEFRAVFEDAAKNRIFTSDSLSALGKTGKVTVTPKIIRCVAQPVNIVAQTGGEMASGKFNYIAEFEYTAPTANAQISWEYKRYATDSYKAISGFPYGGVVGVSTGTPVQIRANTYRVITTLTLTNPPTAMDTGNTHYYFRAKAVAGNTAYSGSADISFHYKIDIKPGAPVVRLAADGASKTYSYPNLTVFAPEGVRNLRIVFESDSMAADATMKSKRTLGGITEIAGQKGFLYNRDTPLSSTAVRDFLRQIEIVVGSQNVNLEWFIAGERMSGSYDPLTGKYYEFVQSTGITWAQSFDRARSHYNSILQAQGQLATIRSDAQNNFVRSLLGEKTAWIGATNDRAYLPGENGGQYRWIDGSTLSYDRLTSKPGGSYYAQIQPNGTWLAARNTQSMSVTATDYINYSGNGIGGWRMESGILQGTAPEGVDNSNGYTGLLLLAPESTGGVDSCAAHDVYLQNGHKYWIYGHIGEYGDSNGNMLLSTPFGRIASYWYSGGATMNGIYTWTGANSWQTIRTQTNGNGPNYTGVGGQMYHLEVVNLTQTFTLNGMDIPTAQWLTDNIGVFSGNRIINYTSNTSKSGGYVVEYVVGDNLPTHTAKTARATAALQGVRPGEVPPAIVRKGQYRAGTQVLISCDVMGLTAVNPESLAFVTFKITAPNGAVNTQIFTETCVPAGASQRAYVQYHVPDAVGNLRVDITTSGNLQADTSRINGTVVRVSENPPPNPKATDRSDTFTLPSLPSFTNATQHVWSTYTCQKNGDGWSYTEHENAVTLQAVLQTQPDAEVPTAQGKTMRSGYGINASITATVSGSGASHIIPAQTVLAYFPEFRYQGYWRLLEPMQRSAAYSAFQFKANGNSMVSARLHFLPVWYPDGTYRTYATLRDVWTPVGELMQAVSDTVNITGSVFDDWYVGKSK